MRTLTTGRALALTGTGIVLAGILISSLWTWIPNKPAWGDWLVVAVWWLLDLGFAAVIAYSIWVDLKPRQDWFPAVALAVLIVSSILFFTGGPAIGDLVALVGLFVAAAIAWWNARRSR